MLLEEDFLLQGDDDGDMMEKTRDKTPAPMVRSRHLMISFNQENSCAQEVVSKWQHCPHHTTCLQITGERDMRAIVAVCTILLPGKQQLHRG